MPKHHWFPFFVWCISGSLSPFLLLVELGAAIKVASMIVPCFMAMPLALRCLFTVSKICLPRSCFSNRWRKLRIVVSSGILSLIRLMPVNHRIVGTSISTSSIAGSLRSYHCCIRWIRSIVSNA